MSKLILSCGSKNDLYRTLGDNGVDFTRLSTPTEAVENAPPRSGVMILADEYPDRTTQVAGALFETAEEKGLRLYIEYPSYLPGVSIGPIRTHTLGEYACNLDREVIASDAFGTSLKKMRILQIHGCRYLEMESERCHIVTARVAGYESAPFGLPEDAKPILFEHPRGDILVSTTKLSHFIAGRYAPAEAWVYVWRMILSWFRLEIKTGSLTWTPTVAPTYTRADAVEPDAETAAIARSIEWFDNSRLFIEPSGKEGFHEGFSSKGISVDGLQSTSEQVRADCHGEVSMSFSLAAKVLGKDSLREVARNLNDLIYFVSPSAKGPRMDPASPSYGLIGGDMKPGQSRVPFDLVQISTALDGSGVYYGDDAARHLLGTAVCAAMLNTDRWDERMLMEILANFRTTGPWGFRKARIEEPELQEMGWRHFWHHSDGSWGGGNPIIPHYQAYLWSVFLWLYDKTGFRPLLERTLRGIRSTMNAFPDGWGSEGNRHETERCRMLLPLAWLLRVDDTEEHREWLRLILEYVLATQHASGAIRHGIVKETTSNDQYGTGECALIQSNGDPVADLLYATNFAFVGLHEAAAVTADREILQAEDRLADFLIRIQTKSKIHPELSGAWYRGFDFKRWDYWGSDGDIGWGVWAIETGWTQSWIASTFAMRKLQTNMWDLTAENRIGDHMDTHRPIMLPDDELVDSDE